MATAAGFTSDIHRGPVRKQLAKRQPEEQLTIALAFLAPNGHAYWAQRLRPFANRNRAAITFEPRPFASARNLDRSGIPGGSGV